MDWVLPRVRQAWAGEVDQHSVLELCLLMRHDDADWVLEPTQGGSSLETGVFMKTVAFEDSARKALPESPCDPASGRVMMVVKRSLLAGSVVAAVAFTACGQESEARKARRLDVQGLASATLSLATGPEARCSAMTDYVERFSEQHVPAVYQGISCSSDNPDELKLSFSVLEKPEGKSIGEIVVYLRGINAQFLLCQQGSVVSAEDPAESSCSFLRANERVDGLPQIYRKDSLKVQDFVFSFSSYVQG